MNGISLSAAESGWVLMGLSILYLAPVILVTLWFRRQRKDERMRSKPPFKELRRRPAGESLRLKIASLDETIDERIMMMVLLPTLLAFVVYGERFFNLYVCIGALFVSIIWSWLFKRKLEKLLAKRRNCQLGFDGERFVGEEISRLFALGFEIYHDVPFDDYNTDHVLVGQEGVFSIETKYRSMPVDDSGEKDYTVEYKNGLLHWPHGSGNSEIKQAAANAESLSKWLSSAVGEPVQVNAILTLPGWYVDRKSPPDGVYVVNAKEIKQVCSNRPKILSETLLKRICHQLNQKCRLEID